MIYPKYFSKDRDINFWVPTQSLSDLQYSDGTSEEKYLEQCVRKAKDLSCHSAELASFIRDWPSEFHFTSKRSNLLRPLQWDQCESVLELGAGCGAITSIFIGIPLLLRLFEAQYQLILAHQCQF